MFYSSLINPDFVNINEIFVSKSKIKLQDSSFGFKHDMKELDFLVLN